MSHSEGGSWATKGGEGGNANVLLFWLFCCLSVCLQAFRFSVFRFTYKIFSYFLVLSSNSKHVCYTAQKHQTTCYRRAVVFQRLSLVDTCHGVGTVHLHIYRRLSIKVPQKCHVQKVGRFALVSRVQGSTWVRTFDKWICRANRRTIIVMPLAPRPWHSNWHNCQIYRTWGSGFRHISSSCLSSCPNTHLGRNVDYV